MMRFTMATKFRSAGHPITDIYYLDDTLREKLLENVNKQLIFRHLQRLSAAVQKAKPCQGRY